MRSPLALTIFDAGRARASQQHARRLRTGCDLEVGALARRLEIGGGGRRAVAVADGVLAAPESLLLLAVVVVASPAGRPRLAASIQAS